ncbi:unnamed protein product, partial [Coregonus sp. 'balchen']
MKRHQQSKRGCQLQCTKMGGKYEIPQPSSTATQEPTTSQVPTTTAQSSNKNTIPKACPICHKTFKFEATMVRHIETFLLVRSNKCPDILKCTICEAMFSCGMDLKSHNCHTIYRTATINKTRSTLSTMALADDVGWLWSPEETKALISVWSDEQILLKMEQTCRNKHVYREISERLKDLGVKRTWKQCQNKMKALKYRYGQTRRDPCNSDRTTCPFFSELDEFLAAMPDMTESKETGDAEGRPLPLSSLRLLVPPLRLVSAALWQVVQRRDTMDYGLVEEFVTTVLEIIPDLMSYREKVQLIMGLRAQLVLELCRSDHSADLETIQPHLSKMRTCIITHREREIDPHVEASESNFLELVQTLLDDPIEREHFFQTASWLRPAPSMLKECAQSVTQPQPLKTLLQHHRCHDHLFTNERVEMDIDEARSHSQSIATCAPRNERDTLIEQDNAEKERGMSLDTVKMAVEMIDRRTEEWGENNYEERLQHQLAYDVLQVEIVDGEDMSSTSLTTADNVGGTWSPKETEALISVWSNKQILQEMERSYRKKHVYSEISKQMKDLGVKRTWKQCQTKIKDMKFSYRQTLRNPSSSGRVTCPFFSELHTFLAATPDTTDIQFPESKETGKVSVAEVKSSDQDEGPSVDVKLENLHEEMASRKETHKTLTGEQTEGRKLDEAFHSPQCHSRMKIRRISHRCEQMVEDKSDLDLQPVVLLTPLDETLLMTDRRIVFHKGKSLYKCPLCMKGFGKDRSKKRGCPSSEVFKKRRELGSNENVVRLNSTRNKCPDIFKCSFCEEIFSRCMDLKSHYSRTHQFTGPFPCPSCQKTFVSLTELRLHQRNESTMSLADDVGWTWSPEETKALISVWSDEQILLKMEQTYRNKHVYREISERLNDLGVKRTWKQCQNKMKALKWRYRETLRNPSSRPCPFFSELHEFLAAMPDMPESKETDDEEDNGRPLPLSSLRLLVPPLRLVSAALWQVVQRRDTMDYGLVEEFVTTVLEIIPDLMSYREKVQLIMGLRAQLVLELCRSDHSADLETIQPHLSRMRTCIITHREREIDTQVEASESNFLELVQTLLDDPIEREHFFQVAHSSFADDRILSSLSQTLSERVEIDIYEARSHSQSIATCAPRNERDTLIEQGNAEKERGMSLDTVKKAVEMMDRRTEEWRENNYEERLQHQLAYDVLQVEIVDGEDMSSTSSLTADEVGWTCWTPEETKALISVWSDEQILHKMEQSYRKKHVYREISECLKELGVKKTTKQCHNKMKALKWRYRETLRNPSSRPCPFFSELHTFLADMPESKETGKVSDGEVMSSDQDKGPSVDVELVHLNEEMVSRKVKDKTLTGDRTEVRKRDEAFCSPQSDSKMKIPPKKRCRKPMVEDMSSTTLADGTRAWTLEGTKALISIWSNKQVLQMMEQSYRKKHAYSEVSERLKNLGIKRTWKQCQSKIKHMKHSYRQVLRNPSSSGRATCPFFSELHKFLATMPDMPESNETGKVSDGEVMSSDQDEGPSVDVELEHLNEEMVSRKVKDKTLTGDRTEARKGDESISRKKQAVEDMSDLELQPVVLLTQLDDNGCVTGRILFKCPLCLKGFAFLSALKKHQSNKRGCPTSEAVKKRRELWSKNPSARILPGLSLNTNNSKTCPVCHATFSQTSSLKSHYIYHHDPDKSRFKCHRCLKAFVSHSQMKRHQQSKRGCQLERVHKNRSKPAWSLAPRENKNEIPQPSSTATQEPTTSQVPTTTAQSSNKKTIPKACPICHKTFKFEATMVRHIASHQKESLNKCPDILKCTFCEEIFSQGMDLKSHYS